MDSVKKALRITSAPQRLHGTVNLPSSKSISNRALMIRALSGQDFRIDNLSTADDTRLLYALFKSDEDELYVKNAGTVMRFLTAFYACREGEIILRGSERMDERPIGALVEALKSMGADIDYLGKEGYSPLHIRGRKLKGGRVSVAANISSQFISAILMIAPLTQEGILLEMTGDIVSKPYIDMTLSMLTYFGIHWEKKDSIIFIPPQTYQGRDLYVEADWSAAVYFWGLAALFPGSELKFPHLFSRSWQGDRVLEKLISCFGISSAAEGNGYVISSNGQDETNFRTNLIGSPDLIPAMTTLCCTTGMDFRISGIETLRHKETDRIAALYTELGKLGFHIYADGEKISYTQTAFPVPPKDVRLDSYGDHRMAMSWAIAASQNPHLIIDNPGCVEKSFPHFWEELTHLGFKLEEAIH
jgi:3-phosphoshikimate 1-carboxyvinyltransferase